MMAEHDRAQCARRLSQAWHTGVPVPPLTQQFPAMTIEDAYDIQQRQIEAWKNRGDNVVGYKIGLTSAAMQRALGVDQPDFGALMESMRYTSGQTIDRPLIQPKVEPEIAFVLDRVINSPEVTAHDVMKATRYVCPALEIIDSRIQDWKIQLADTVADNASAACFVLGPARPLDALGDLSQIKVALFQNDRALESGVGADVMDHPAQAVAWLLNTLRRFGQHAQAGDVILSGSVTAAIGVKPGDMVSVRIPELGDARVNF